MRKEDYKRALDDIKCTDEFREKMEKMLTVPEGVIPEGYEDSVSSVEIAPKRSWLKTAAISAAAVVLIGGAGAGTYNYLRNMDMDGGPSDVIATEPDREAYSTPFGDVSRMMLTINGENGFSLLDVPESMVRDIAEVLNENELVHLEQEKGEGTYEEVKPLIVDCYGESQFALWVYPNGLEHYEVGTENKEPLWYSCEDIYTKIQGAVAKNIVYADLSGSDIMCNTDGDSNLMSALSDTEKTQKIRSAFEKYADSIELDYTSEGYPLLNSDIMNEDDIVNSGYSAIVFGNYASFMVDNRFVVKINKGGGFEVFYASKGGVGQTYVFKAPAGLCTEIHDILTDESSTTPPWGDTDWGNDTSLAFYHDGCQHTYPIGADNEFRSYLETLEWLETGLPEGDFHAQNEFDFFIGDGILKIDAVGNAYYDKISGGDYFYKFDEAVYENLLSYLKLRTGKTFEHEGTLPERVRECLSDNESLHWGKYRVAETDGDNYINFTVDDDERSRLIEAIESTEWEESPNMVEDSYILNVAFIIDGFWFDRFGDICDHDDGKIFSAVESDRINEINEILERILKKDSCAYAQYMLLEPKMKYTSMRCAVLPLGMTYEEASVDGSINKDLDELRNGLLSDLQTINIHS
ncbi:MAG: hypothetical protein Q4A05_11620, partial [Ruminococcus sp.]|nr:hypothetical protein [Ruminococcus sp.]